MAIDTKKKLEQDFTQQPQATTQEDVNNQDTATRVWQSLSNTYNNQMEESDKAYDKSISQLNNSMLARGMQRSSYALHEAAHMYDDKNNARNKLGQALIADYQNRIGQIEEAEAARKFQADEAQKSRDWQSNENALNRTYQTSEREAQQGWQSSENALNREQSQRQFEIQQAFNEKQWQAQQDQWKQEFEYNKMSTDQKLAYESIMTIIGQGNDPSDDLLARAGLSRADVNAMKAQTVSSGGGYRGNGNGNGGENGSENGDKPKTLVQSFMDGLNNFMDNVANNTNTTSKTQMDTKTAGDVKNTTVNGTTKIIRGLANNLIKKPKEDERK